MADPVAEAVGRLEAWVEGDDPNRRWYTVNRWSDGRVEVTLYPVRLGGALYFKGEESTLPAAVEAALRAAEGE